MQESCAPASPDPQFRYLHFELCYYQALEEAIARRLRRVEAGAQGEHKLQRGYLPTLTFSSHWLQSPVMKAVVNKVGADPAYMDRMCCVLRGTPGQMAEDFEAS
jgi:predicted N-acyltransferase